MKTNKQMICMAAAIIDVLRTKEYSMEESQNILLKLLASNVIALEKMQMKNVLEKNKE